MTKLIITISLCCIEFDETSMLQMNFVMTFTIIAHLEFLPSQIPTGPSVQNFTFPIRENEIFYDFTIFKWSTEIGGGGVEVRGVKLRKQILK